MYLWVRGQDLLGECRARAGHAEDEGGALGRQPRRPQSLERRSVEHCERPRDTRGRCRAVVRRSAAAGELVASPVILECRIEVANVVAVLAERVVEPDGVRDR
jgi:hypothetical protein